MAKIAKQLTELIGHTPLLELTNYEKALGLVCIGVLYLLHNHDFSLPNLSMARLKIRKVSSNLQQ